MISKLKNYIHKFKEWYSYNINGKDIIHYDTNKNVIYTKSAKFKYEDWYTYDLHNNPIHFKQNTKGEDNYEWSKTYDDKNQVIHAYDSSGDKYWYAYNASGLETYKKHNDYEKWTDYDDSNRIILEKDSNGNEHSYDYNDKGILTLEIIFINN